MAGVSDCCSEVGSPIKVRKIRVCVTLSFSLTLLYYTVFFSIYNEATILRLELGETKIITDQT
jgi:hypothetical protein